MDNLGSLICAVLVCAKVIFPHSAIELVDQLSSIGCGLEIECWSDLPKGSGKNIIL